MKRIKSLEELKKEASSTEGRYADFFIQLNAGARSSKQISYNPQTKRFNIINEIDYSYQDNLSEKQLTNRTHIALAIQQGAFLSMNIKFSYLYRDGANYKNFGEIIFSNPFSRSKEEVEAIVAKHLIDGRWFYCKEWDVPDLHFKEFGYDIEIDVEWHQFESIEATTEVITDERTIEDFISHMEEGVG